MTNSALHVLIEDALANGELVPWYQPQIALASGAVVGAEALLRWEHPTKGVLGAASVVPLAEQSSLICVIGREMLMQACADTAEIGGARSVAVNVGARHLDSPDLLRDVADALDAASLAPARLEIELTETVLCRDTEGVRRAVAGLADMGVVLAIDDYATGYATLEYLSRLRPSVMKIARRARGGVSGVSEERCLAALREARRHSLRVVAENIETVEMAHFFASQGVERGQGFLYSAAMPHVQYQSTTIIGSRAETLA